MGDGQGSKLVTIQPSPSYEITLPAEVSQGYAGIVASFWMDSSLALQLSGYKRKHGEQVSAAQRLKDRMDECGEKWSIWDANVHPDTRIDQATGEYLDENGVVWLHSYLVWPHYTIYATVAIPKGMARERADWALQGVASIRMLTGQFSIAAE
ncbi:MAG TPA: hypothetical protein VNX22_09425 [Acidobacteriaceae bacterium]|jgi:hypothetical protein|nr:hypothetical protein [Acidobacteriaceae bacterium]